MATYLIGNVKGPKGEDGYSPKASVTQTSNGAIISIQDADGLTTAEIRNGVDGDGNNIDLSPYATKVEVEGEFEALADTYATIDYVDQEVAGVIAPVTSVNGQTGDVNIALPDLTSYATQTWVTGQGYLTEAPVATVNGQTGTVELDAEDVGALPEDTVIPTKVSDLTNDSGFLNATTLAPYLANKQDTLTAGTNITISNGVISASGGSSFSGDYDDLTNKPDLSVYAESADLATVATTGDYDDLTNKPTIPVLPTLATVATTGDYTDLSNTPTIPTVPTTVSSFTNDAGYITSADLPADELPTIASGDAGKVLTVNSGETGVEWATASGGGGATYTAGNGIEIDANNVISNSGINPLTTLMWRLNDGGFSGAGYETFNNSSTWEDFIASLKTGKVCYISTSTSYTFSNDYKITAILMGVSSLWGMNLKDLPLAMMGAGPAQVSVSGMQVYYQTFYYFDGTTIWVWGAPEDLGNYIKVKYRNENNKALGYALKLITDSIDTKQDALPALTNNAGKVLTVNSGATGVEWAEASGGGTSYTAGDNITIDANNVISVDGLELTQNSQVIQGATNTTTVSGGEVNISVEAGGNELGSIGLNAEQGRMYGESAIYNKAISLGMTGLEFGDTANSRTVTLAPNASYSGLTINSDNVVVASDLSTALSGKQDTLTAGTGISISNNVISATGGSGGGSITDPIVLTGNESSGFTPTNTMGNSAIVMQTNGEYADESTGDPISYTNSEIRITTDGIMISSCPTPGEGLATYTSFSPTGIYWTDNAYGNAQLAISALWDSNSGVAETVLESQTAIYAPVYLISPDGSHWRLTVDNSGNLSAEKFESDSGGGDDPGGDEPEPGYDPGEPSEPDPGNTPTGTEITLSSDLSNPTDIGTIGSTNQYWCSNLDQYGTDYYVVSVTDYQTGNDLSTYIQVNFNDLGDGSYWCDMVVNENPGTSNVIVIALQEINYIDTPNDLYYYITISPNIVPIL